MIYDLELTLYRQQGRPMDLALNELGSYLYAEAEVYHRRYWEAVQAGQTIDTMAMLPEHLNEEGELYARLADGFIYRVVQEQRGWDENNLPFTTLSLSRESRRYEILNKDVNDNG